MSAHIITLGIWFKDFHFKLILQYQLSQNVLLDLNQSHVLFLSVFGVNEQKCLIGCMGGNDGPEPVSKTVKLFGIGWTTRNRNPNLTQIEHVYATCCRPEVTSFPVKM